MLTRKQSNKLFQKRLRQLNDVILFEVGESAKWNTVNDFHQWLIAWGEKGHDDFRGLPLSFCIKFTKPAE